MSDMREQIALAITDNVEVLVDGDGFDVDAEHAVSAILAIPAIAAALAGRDAVIEQCAGAAENARVRCDWNGCHFAGPNPSGCAYPDDILEYRYSVDVAAAIRALKTGAAPLPEPGAQ